MHSPTGRPLSPPDSTPSASPSTGRESGLSAYTSVKEFGQQNAAVGKAGLVAEEVLSFGPGNVDDVVALVHLGGTFDGMTVPALCMTG